MTLVVNKSERLIIVGSFFISPTIPIEISDDAMASIKPFIDSGEIELMSETKPDVEEVKAQKPSVETKPHSPTLAELRAAAQSQE